MINHTAGGVSITGPDIEIFRQRQIARGLALEISTGMKVGKRGQNLVALANAVSGGVSRTKKRALADLVREWDDVPVSVQRALAKS